MSNIALVTYTNSNLRDVWPVYFGQVDKHLSGIKSYVFSDEKPEISSSHNIILYDNSDPYYVQYSTSMESVEEDFVIYSQEDFVLYDNVSQSSLNKYVEFLKNSDYSFVKLIRSGYKTPLLNKAGDEMFEIDVNSQDAFSMQAILWKKDKLMALYDVVRSNKWYESSDWNQSCIDLDVRGVFVYKNENQRGKFHYDSDTFPYVCTALNKGLWNLNEYPEILGSILKSYNIDPAERGYRTYYGQVRA